jgi:hypothetical protein
MPGQLKVVTPVSVVKCLPLPRRRSLARLHRELGITGPVCCVVNGRPVLRRKRPRYSGWSQVPRRTDVVEFVILPQGGNRQSNKDIVRTVALLALVIAAPSIIGAALPTALAGTWMATAASAALVVGGGLLLNVLLPPAGPASDPAKQESASPTYNIDAQGNVARLGQPIPKQYGRHMMVCDFAARPYVRYVGQDQYLHTLLSCGLGKYQTHAIRMDRTDLWNETVGNPNIIDGVEVQICPPGTQVTLFHTAVYTSSDVSGIEFRKKTLTATTMTFNATSITSSTFGSPADLGVEVFRSGDEVIISGFTGGAASNNGTRFVQSVNQDTNTIVFSGSAFPFQGTATGDLALSTNIVEIGPYSVCPPGSRVTNVEVDVVFPNGLGQFDNDGNLGNYSVGVRFDVRIVDDNGNPLTGWFPTYAKTFTGKTRTPVRETFTGGFGAFRYEIKGYRTTDSVVNAKILQDVQWTGLRGFLVDDNIYPDVTTVAVKMRASGQLSAQSSRMINVIQTAKLPIWNDENYGVVFASGRYVSAGDHLHYERNQPWSLIAVIQGSSLPASFMSIASDNGNASFKGFNFLAVSGTGVLQFVYGNAGGGNYLHVAGSIPVIDGQRHVVGMTYDGSSSASGVKLYVDGLQDTGVTIITNALSSNISYPAGNDFLIGNRADLLTTAYFRGIIGYVRVSNVVRPLSYFQQQKAEGDTSTTLAYDFFEGTGTTTNDFSSNNYDGTLSTSAMWSALPEWSAPFPTRATAWALADIARNEDYGAALPDSRLDTEELLTLNDIWTPRSETFDGIFDRAFTVWDAMKSVALVGRAQPIMVGGTVSFVRDAPDSLARGVFTPQNIRRGTFKTTHILYDNSTPDDAIVSYMDEVTWRQKEVRATLPVSDSAVPVNLTAFGIVDRTRAWRFGIYNAASNLYRRKFCSFNTDMEGKLILKSQVVLVSHDVPKWGSSGRVVSFDRPTRKLTLDEDIDWSYGGQYYLSLSQPNNEEWGPVKVSVGVSNNIAIMDSGDFAAVEVAMGTIPFLPFDSNGEPTRFTAGPSTKYAQRMKLVSSNPTAIDNVELSLVIDDLRVFDYVDSVPGAGVSTPSSDPIITDIAAGLIAGRGNLFGISEA